MATAEQTEQTAAKKNGAPMDYRFNAITVDPDNGLIDIDYDESSVGGWTNHGLNPPQKAMESFYTALNALKEVLAESLPFSKAGKQNLYLARIKYAHQKKGEHYVTADLKGAWGDFEALNTYKLSRRSLEGEIKRRIDDLEFEAIDFIQGKRGQLMLPLKEPEGDGEEGKDGDLFEGDGEEGDGE